MRGSSDRHRRRADGRPAPVLLMRTAGTSAGQDPGRAKLPLSAISRRARLSPRRGDSTLLRTTGAGFCYNIGRVASAVGTVVFGLISTVHDYRTALIAAGCLFLPSGLLALALPGLDDPDA